MGRKNILNEARDQDEQEENNEQSEPEREPGAEENQDDTDPVSDRDQETRKWTHRAPEGLVEEIDEYTEERHFPSRKFTINYILREHLEERR